MIGRGRAAGFESLAARRGVGDRMRWLGPRPDTERWYAAADAVVLPTRYEPFGNVHLEALASGVPMVASNRAGGAELIQDGVNGYVVDPLDPAAVAGRWTGSGRHRRGSWPRRRAGRRSPSPMPPRPTGSRRSTGR